MKLCKSYATAVVILLFFSIRVSAGE